MNAGTLLRKLRLQEALSEDELNAYLAKLKPDGSLPSSEVPVLLELMTQRTDRLSVEDIRAVAGLVDGNCDTGEKAGGDEANQAMRAIVSNLTKR